MVEQYKRMIVRTGSQVLYTLTAADAAAVNKRRDDFRTFCISHAGQPPATGYVGHVGTRVSEGHVCAATVVKIFMHSTAVNLQVHLDGNDTLWVTCAEGSGPGFWFWHVPASQ